MDLLIHPHTLKGKVKIPASKSILHRALICAALAKGRSLIRNTYLSEDITATMDCLKKLGASFTVTGDCIAVDGISSLPEEASLDCGESGSTIRFLIPLAAALGVSASFAGRGKLVSRPLHLYQQAFAGKGVEFLYNGSLPASVCGQLQSGDYEIPGNVSSQFITGLLFALPLLDGDSRITVLPPFESKSYVGITISCLKQFGISVTESDHTYFIKGNQCYTACDYTVESDYSQSAFFLTANCLGSELSLFSFAPDSIQGDSKILSILAQSGTEALFQNGNLQTHVQNRKAFSIDASDIPDLVPILSVLACFCEGTTKISRIERLRIKESDRIASTMGMIHALGGRITYENDCLLIPGSQQFSGGTVDCCNDHRIAMAAAVASTVCDGDVVLKGAQCVKKSYPTFFEEFTRLGGNSHVVHVE